MPQSIASTRRYQIIFVILLVVCVAQLGWWLLDQWMFSTQVQQSMYAMHEQNLQAARAMLEAGAPLGEVAALFPGLTTSSESGTLEIDPAAIAALQEARRRRINRYGWEGGFFLIVLLAAISVLWRAVRAEARLRRRQHNFVTAVTHELKTPLTSMRLSAETLELRDAEPEARKKLIDRMLSSLERMEYTVSNVLETSRIDEGNRRTERAPVRIADCIRETIETMSPTAEAKNIALHSEVSEQLTLHVDPEALATVLRNLTANALEATGGIPDAAVSLTAQASGSTIVIEVSDNGRGFDPGEADKLFEKFYRPGNELRRVSRGTGLGLYIARQLVTEAGGRLEAHSDGPRTGATFRASWPNAAADSRDTGSGR